MDGTSAQASIRAKFKHISQRSETKETNQESLSNGEWSGKYQKRVRPFLMALSCISPIIESVSFLLACFKCLNKKKSITFKNIHKKFLCVVFFLFVFLFFFCVSCKRWNCSMAYIYIFLFMFCKTQNRKKTNTHLFAFFLFCAFVCMNKGIFYINKPLIKKVFSFSFLFLQKENKNECSSSLASALECNYVIYHRHRVWQPRMHS